MPEKLSPIGRSLIVPTVGQVLEDGVLLELLRAEPRSTRLSLLCRRGKLSWGGRRLRLGGRSYVPADIPSSVVQNMHLPTKTVKSGSTRALFDDLVQTFEQTMRLPGGDAQLSSYFVFGTYFVA